MEESGKAGGDRDLCERILQGAVAIAELQERFRKSLERYLVGMCDRGDGQSQNKAVEIASQILADCFAKTPPLLEQWKGHDNLEAFLRKAAANRLKSYWASAEKTRMVGPPNPDGSECASDSNTGAGDEEIGMAREALRSGVAQAARKCPEGLVFLRLKGLHGVDQRAISECWGHHESQTSRRIREAMNLIRTTAGEEAVRLGLALTFDDFQQALQRNPSILLGSEGTMPGPGDESILRMLAAGKADAAARHAAVEILCANPTALEFFAQLLNRAGESQLVVAKDLELSGMAARLAECVRRSVEVLRPEEAGGLISPLMADFFADALRAVGADGGTLWLLRPGEPALEAVFNPLEPEIAGKRQPLVSGIVSLVLATGESACVSGVAAHECHSPAIDAALGKVTRGMMAVPFVLAGSARGVLTAISLTRDDAFGPRETARLGRCSSILAKLMIGNLTERILG